MRGGLLAACALLVLLTASCRTEPAAEEDTTAVTENETEPLAQNVTVVGFLEEERFPTDDDFREWLTQARKSEQIDYAVLTVAEGTGYRCYLYSAVRGKDDAVRVGLRTLDGVLVLRPDAPSEQETGAGSDMLFCFTVDADEPPRMEIFVDGDAKGFRSTYVEN